MPRSSYRHGLAADALATAAVAAFGLLLLWCGTRMLPAAAVAGSALFSPDPLAGGSVSPAALTHAAGFCAAAGGVLLTLWWLAGFACALAGCLLHRFGFRSAGRRTLSLAPGPLRRLAAAALGLSLAAGTAPALGAGPGTAGLPAAAPPALDAALVPAMQPAGFGPGAAVPVPAPADTAEAVSPLWRPAPPQPAAGNLLTGSPRPDEREVVVAAGDTLWSLAAAQLGPQATDAETAALWPHWYELNRETIGPDPGLIHPGQILIVPQP